MWKRRMTALWPRLLWVPKTAVTLWYALTRLFSSQVQEGEKGVPVGKTIAMLAEEGDDISNVEVPADDSKSAPSAGKEQIEQPKADSQAPSTSQSPGNTVQSAEHSPKLSTPMLPSVTRLLIENHVSQADAEKIKGTGMRGMLTKGDVLSFLGKASSPTGSFKEVHQSVADLGAPTKGAGGSGSGAKLEKKSEPLTAGSIRSLIMGGLADSSRSARSRTAAPSPKSTGRSAFDELLDDYQFAKKQPPKSSSGNAARNDGFAGLL